MTEGDWREALYRAIGRRAERNVRRGWWTEGAAREAARTELAQRFPDGRATPDHRFHNVVDATSGAWAGEVWTVVETKGGKTHVWVDWIWIEPAFRRRGFATETLRRIEESAIREGAERIGLYVVLDNPEAFALYSKLGYRPYSQEMTKSLGPPRAPERP
jgi:ribosomal protein S18 acetylase RimI-like enzyme